jgi:amino acid adenylation domain-containing protein
MLLAERDMLLHQWSNAQDSYPPSHETCLHTLLEAQIERTPNAVALAVPRANELQANGAQVHRSHTQEQRLQTLTYQQLDQQANRLAHYLQRQGVGPDVPVGIALERTSALVVALLGTLKAGGAYVPLDPTYPAKRLDFIVQDAQMPLVLTHSRLKDRFAGVQAKVICLDAIWPELVNEAANQPLSPVQPSNLAYVIYTSGSTGQPKGVMIEHRSVAAFVQTAAQAYAIQPQDRVLQFASINFDTSIEEIYPCLIQGATLVLRSEAMLDSLEQFAALCQAWEITVLDLPTAYWHELVLGLSSNNVLLPQTLRLLIIGGEHAWPDRLQMWYDQVGIQVQLLNTYGPTETTVVATLADLTEEQPLTIGRPIRGTQAYVLDHHQNPTPIGVPGELYVGGISLARGYLNQPVLTAERFIELQPGLDKIRLYKTGDLVRWRDEGTLEFLGRVDDQVKLRGFRIELREVENCLQHHPQVDQAVVVLHTPESGPSLLVAYIVADNRAGEGGLEVSALRAYAAEILPAYMVPSRFLVLDDLPMTPNGKVNRQALPAFEQAEMAQSEEFVPPRTALEISLAEMWQDILGVMRVGITDNFFALGGHSLLAMQLLARINKQFEVSLPLRHLFEAPTVANLALLIAQTRAEAVDSSRVAELLSELDDLTPEEVQALLDNDSL